MPRIAAASLLLALALLLGGRDAPTIDDSGEFLLQAGLSGAVEAREEAEEMQAPSDAILARQLFGSDTGPAKGFRRARVQARALAQTGGAWEFVGPVSVGGRVMDIAVDPVLADTIYVAAASGGVWKSTDAGRTFTSVWPDGQTQAIGALAITPSGVLFAGTGEAGPGGGSLTYGGNGVYRSRDRGQTWERVGLPQSGRIGRVVVDPTDERRIWVAAGGHLYQPGGERGLYLSEDGGDTWKLALEGDNETTGAVDIAIDPSDPDRMFVAMWDLLREPDLRRYEGPGSGLFRSEDGGETWEPVLPGLFGPGNPVLGRIGVTIAPSDPSRVYVILTGPSGAHAGLYRSDDGGTTFRPSTDDPSLILASYTYGWWFGRIFVDPQDADHVFVAGVNFPESEDGGMTWADVPGVHADQHALVWDPKVPGRVYLGNDGGVYRQDQPGGRFQFAESQPWHQLYGLDVSEQDPSRMTAGLQDNGAVRSYPEKWNEYVGGDGQRTLINPTDQDIVYGCYQYGECSVSHDGGDDTESFTNKVVSTRKNWFTPIELDPEDSSIVYTGGELLNRSPDDAESFEVISPELSNGPGRETNPLFKNFGTLTTIAPAGKSTGTIYAGTDDGNLWYTHSDGGPAGWTQADDPDLPEAWITRLAVQPGDPMTAYVTYSGFRTADEAPYVLRTRDGGESWESITGDLPQAPVNDIVVVEGQLVVASDVGVFRSRDGGASWQRAGTGVPLAPVFDLRYHAPTRTLYAGTFGRGIYRVAIDALDRPATPPSGTPAPVRPKRPRLVASCVRRGRATLRVRGASVRRLTVRARGRKARSVRRGRIVVSGLRGRRPVVRVVVLTRDGGRAAFRARLRRCR